MRLAVCHPRQSAVAGRWSLVLILLAAALLGALAARWLVPRPAPAPATPVARSAPPKAPIRSPAAERPKVAEHVVCIDPGHPSENGIGAVAADGLRELDMNWRMAELLRDSLKARGQKALLSRAERSARMSNARRAEVANTVGAELLVRLHCDANGGQGYAVYYPAEPGRAGGRSGPSAAVRGASGRAADALVAALDAALAGDLASQGVRTDRETAVGRRQGALTGSVFSRVPVVTVEMVDLTHADDVRWIRNAANRGKLAAALADGIMRYLEGGR